MLSFIPKLRSRWRQVKSLPAEIKKLAESQCVVQSQISELRSIIQGSSPPSKPSSPFDHMNTTLDPVAIVRSHEDRDRKERQHCRVNYFGVAIPEDVIPASALGWVPSLELDPLPNNWHSDTSEFAAALRAVDLSRDTFTMVELGCGWGCWMNITGACARRRGLQLNLIGVEGDKHNLGLAEKTLSLNGFSSEDFSLHHGIAHAESGTAAFPQQAPGDDQWGLAPVFDSQSSDYRAALRTGKYVELPMIGFRDLAAKTGRIDLVHIDIQGGEAALVLASIDALSECVAYLLIGTHSRPIEGKLFDILGDAGWELEIERPAILDVTGPTVVVDGVQGWRNRNMSLASQPPNIKN